VRRSRIKKANINSVATVTICEGKIKTSFQGLDQLKQSYSLDHIKSALVKTFIKTGK